MAWFELHQTRQRHPKTLRLAAMIGQERRYVCGLLDDLWTWALDVADRDGQLAGLAAEDIAVALDYPRKKGKWLMDALVNSGYVDMDDNGGYAIHDWAEYAGRLNDRRQKDAIRKKELRRKSASCPQDVHGTSVGCPAATVPIPYLEEIEVEEERVREAPNAFTDRPDVPAPDSLEAYISGYVASTMTAAHWQQLDDLLGAGMPEDLIRLAIDEACAQGKSTWAYVHGILQRWLTGGVRTVAQARQKQAEYKAGKARGQSGRTERPPAGPMRFFDGGDEDG